MFVWLGYESPNKNRLPHIHCHMEVNCSQYINGSPHLQIYWELVQEQCTLKLKNLDCNKTWEKKMEQTKGKITLTNKFVSLQQSFVNRAKTEKQSGCCGNCTPSYSIDGDYTWNMHPD